MARKQVRLKDVAEKAGVAVNTASTILNRRPNSWASKETEARVFDAAKELGYRPNRAAVALQSGRFNTVGLLISDMLNPYYAQFASLLGRALEEKGYVLVIENWRNDLKREKSLLEDFVHRNLDGVAAFLSDVDEHREFLESQSKLGFPMVALAMPGVEQVQVDMVMPNFETGLREAATTLHDLGHSKFVFLTARLEGQRVGKRPVLFKELVEGMNGSQVEIVELGPTLEESREVSLKVLSGPDRPTAVVALNDLTAVGVMRAAKELSLDIPGDVSVVGIDGVPIGEFLPVSLSTIVQPIEAMVKRTLEMLLERIEGEDDKGPQQAEFPTKFLKRESIGSVSKG